MPQDSAPRPATTAAAVFAPPGRRPADDVPHPAAPFVQPAPGPPAEGAPEAEKREIQKLAQAKNLTEAEAAEFGPFLHRVSRALQEVTGAVKTYTVLFAEHPEHPHVHFHVVPRAAAMPEENRSTRVFDYLGVPEAETVPLETRNALAEKLRAILERTP